MQLTSAPFISLGLGNRLYKCRRVDATDQNEDTSSTVVVRLIGGNVLPRDAPIRVLNETSETLVFYSLGHLGLGPKLHAVFPGGRIEEFIQSRTMTLTEWLKDPSINVKLGQITARLHMTKHPIKKTPWNVRRIVQRCLNRFKEQQEHSPTEEWMLPEIESSINFDFESQLTFIESILPKLNSKIVFSSNDSNRSNFLVRTKSDGSDVDPLQVMQVDYEFACYNYRAFDIGNYFGMKTFDFGAEVFTTGQGYPSEEYRRQFIQSYIDEINRIGPPSDWDPEGRDSLEHILLEADFGSYAVRVINVAWTLRDVKIWTEMVRKKKEKDPNARLEFDRFPPYCHERRKHFVQRHKEWLEKHLNGKAAGLAS